ncbi:flagellar hook-basal body complex protein [Rhodovulum sp. BSW8]|uniref:Flagellar hook protein FlgE n=1 Tax=Rhodovulum visakhapatnamense TaxID=364297 RepID=A0A4R8G943_9RHOB|nr:MULTISPECIES: flagellar hook-basal body complex protein [Rhodovulum]OLS43265.1 flagellar biosynthesis protein FlgE [Rhodovulum sulfidophilum]MBL3568321.1 flagellar hook-basal body complex protein [Rhodovulum visakhapatnamense]MBL3578846.1 flagellar hook-basal body complex protein [Rhodovulum visakhapatnamense]RBO53212.1 flagellar hook-basal body complex protein [Rhodovulum sp. BSW8]TDX31996.1 flagellar hook protein FlgE [Rhodovulum visakhapatnamense]
MTISSSLNASVAGLAANATRLATISDNIANSSTYGYKTAEADFHSMVINGSRGSYSAGGVRTTTTRMIDQSGALLTTANATDLAVRGRGFLPVMTESELISNVGNYTMYMTTTGSFRTDEDGYLKTSTGLVLMGWPADASGTIPSYSRDTTDDLVPIQIQTNQFATEPTTEMTLGVNLPATETAFNSASATGDPLTLSVEYFDNLGTSQSIDIVYTPDTSVAGLSNTWNMQLTDSATGAVVGDYDLVFDDSQTYGGTLLSVTDNTGGAWDPATGILTVQVGPNADTMSINIGAFQSRSITTQLSDSFAPTSITKNGFPVGNMTSIEIDSNGFVRANFDTGITRTLYQVPIVDVSNPNGLYTHDNQCYSQSDTSGSFFMWDAGDGPTGDVVSYALEESATDVAGELTELIQTQRAYSSNAKVIQTVDEMLQETTNIKR